MKKLLLTAVFALAGCATTPPTNSVVVRCGINSAWSAAEQLDLADALDPIPVASPIWHLEMDWQAMRDANKACANSGESHVTH
jgi:hypothetical protein